MKTRQLIYGVITMIAMAMPTKAEDPPYEPGEAFDQAYAAYTSEVNARLAWTEQAIEAHTDSVINTFAVEDGNTLVQCDAGALVWSNSLGHVELWLDDVEQTISRGVDSSGRLSFSNAKVAGSIDTTADDHVWIELEHEGTALIWIGTIMRNQITNIPVSVPIEQNKTVCVCVGSVKVCPNGRIACAPDMQTPCTYTKSDGPHNSICAWKLVPVV